MDWIGVGQLGWIKLFVLEQSLAVKLRSAAPPCGFMVCYTQVQQEPSTDLVRLLKAFSHYKHTLRFSFRKKALGMLRVNDSCDLDSYIVMRILPDLHE